MGTGSEGKVHIGLHIPTGEKVAVKIIDKLKLNTKDTERIAKEVEILKIVYHRHLVQLY